MNNKYFIYVAFTLLSYCLAGCYASRYKPEKIHQINIDPGFVLNRYNTGFFYDKDSLYFYTHSYPTYKTLRIFNYDGKLVKNIELEPSKLKTDKIKVDINYPDSIYVYSNEKNVLYLLNLEGAIVKKVRLDSIVREKTIYKKAKYPYLNLFPYTNTIIHNNSILLTAFIKDTTYHPPENNYKDLLRYNNQYMAKLPRLMLIKNGLDTFAQVITEPVWINKVIAGSDEVHNVLPYCSWIKDTLIFHLFCDRNIYVLNSDLSLRRKIPVYSKFAPIEYTKRKITDIQDYEINYEAMYRSQIDDVYFDVSKEKYYVSIRLELPLPKKEKPSYTNPFDYNYSLIQYSKNWEKETEVKLPETDIFISFLPNGQFVTQSKSKNPRNITLNFYQWTE